MPTPPARRRAAAIAALLLALPALAGCVRLRDESLLDRCRDVMLEAFPGGGIHVTKKEAVTPASESIAAVVVAVHGFRRDVPAGRVPLRDLAVECRFDEGILTGFRWTTGPLR